MMKKRDFLLPNLEQISRGSKGKQPQLQQSKKSNPSLES